MNLKELEIITFPDGHKHLKTKLLEQIKQIDVSITSFDDLFLLAQLKSINPHIKTLKVNYLLAARCDRKFSNYEALDLKIVSNFINNLGFEKVIILKPHSDIALALIDNSEALSFTSELFIKCVKDNNLKDFSIISPDAGASKWIEKELGRSDIIQCSKNRNETTGEIVGVKISEIPKETCIIVDDLCDGGRTFINIAKELKVKGVNKVYLVVTHGIFSAGFEIFDGLIDRIYCTNSFKEFDNEILKQLYVY